MLPDSPARRLRDAVEPLAVQGFGSARHRLKDLGLRFLPGYVWGRAAALGEPTPAVVVSAFGVFEPTFLAQAYVDGRAGASRADVLAARAAGGSAGLVDAVGDDPLVGALAEVLLAAVAGISGTARPLFSGLRALDLPADPHGRLWRACDLVREHRGDGHLAACIAAGLDPVEMNVLTELYVGYPLRELSATRGHSSEQLDAGIEALRDRGLLDGDSLSSAGRTLRIDIEAATDRSQDELVHALGDHLEWAVATASALSERVIAAGAFTSDPRKRAAG